jgi:hypothetical protein
MKHASRLACSIHFELLMSARWTKNRTIKADVLAVQQGVWHLLNIVEAIGSAVAPESPAGQAVSVHNEVKVVHELHHRC